MDQENKHTYHQQRSYFGPILLITVGILFLGSNLGVIPGGGWGVIWKLWPLLLIVAGLDDLLRRNGIAWPILLIGAGAFLLYNNFGPQSWISWTQLFKLWPVILIAVGIDVLFRDQSGWMTAAGLILTVALISGAVWMFSSGIKVTADYAQVRETMDPEVKSFEVDISLGLGELIVSDLESPRVLIEGNITPDKKEADLKVTGETAYYQLKNNQPDFFPHTARWELGLTQDLDLDLSLNNGVGEMFLSLDNLQLTSLNANQGVGRLILHLPEASDGELLVKQAIGLIQIQIPSGARVAVDAQNGLSKVSFPSGFELENGYYTTPGTTKSNADLLIIVEQAIGLVDIQFAR
jgi:hypothetical protein